MKKISAICFAVLLILSIVGCTTKHYKLTVKDGDAYLYEQPAKAYEAGERVVIKTRIWYDVDLECFVNGQSIGRQTTVQTDGKYTHWEYAFEMPAEDVTITFETVGGKPYGSSIS